MPSAAFQKVPGWEKKQGLHGTTTGRFRSTEQHSTGTSSGPLCSATPTLPKHGNRPTPKIPRTRSQPFKSRLFCHRQTARLSASHRPYAISPSSSRLLSSSRQCPRLRQSTSPTVAQGSDRASASFGYCALFTAQPSVVHLLKHQELSCPGSFHFLLLYQAVIIDAATKTPSSLCVRRHLRVLHRSSPPHTTRQRNAQRMAW